ncbi:MAG: hypothetical protein VZS44_07145 [Bacilli bacterium]|nr:hypothetical protein [Bacilli bacterium]
MNNEIEKNIHNEYDYSNIIPAAEYIGVLIQYCENAYNSFIELTKKDEEKNEKLKLEYQVYEYRKSYSSCFRITIIDKRFRHTDLNNYKVYVDAVNNGQINNLDSLKIELNTSFKRGKYREEKEHDNTHEIIFKPYNIKYIRKSNYLDTGSSNIENEINNLLKKFPYVNTIFCTKK